MTDKEAEEAMKDKSLVRVDPTNLIDIAGDRMYPVLFATGSLIAKKKRGKQIIYHFETSFGEKAEGTASMFRLLG